MPRIRLILSLGVVALATAMSPLPAAAAAGNAPGPSAHFVSAAQYGGPDMPLVDAHGKAVVPKGNVYSPGDVSILINRVDCGDRNDFLKFVTTYDGFVCYANAGYATAGLRAVQSFTSGNNAGAFYFESAGLCAMYSFNKWEGSYLNYLNICLVEIY